MNSSPCGMCGTKERTGEVALLYIRRTFWDQAPRVTRCCVGVGLWGFFSIFLFVQRHRIRAARHLPGFGADSLGSVR